MTGEPIDLLLTALETHGSCFILGAGASAPDVPTVTQLPESIAAYSTLLGSFPAGPIPDSPLRQLISPLVERARITTSLEEWKAAAITDATIVVLLEHLIVKSHWKPLIQYSVFRMFPLDAAVVSFNWDGLAAVRCPQSEVVHPHGRLLPRHIVTGGLDDDLDMSQLFDGSDSRAWVIPGLVLPGEEESQRLHGVREKVFELWRYATCVTVIGYSFGINSGLRYDQVWLDTFVEAMTLNKSAPVHILSPDAGDICSHLVEHLKRTINVYAWCFRWNVFAASLDATARRMQAATIHELRLDNAAMEQLNQRLRNESVAS